MVKRILGTMTAIAVLGLAPAAFANADKGGSGLGGSSIDDSQSGSVGGSSDYGTGGSGSSYGTGSEYGTGGTGEKGTMGQTGSTMGEQQMEGKVLKADSKNITIEHMGAAIPLTVSRNTTFQGVKNAKEIKEGQQVRASFQLKEDKNELQSVQVITGTGGTGSESLEKSQDKNLDKSGSSY